MTRPRSRRPAPPFPSLGGNLEFLRLLWAVDHALQKTSKRMEQALGITGPQRLVIRIVGRFPGISAGDLARILGVHPSTVTGLSKRLIRRGLLRRRTDPRDARRGLISLTEAGRAVDTAKVGTIESAIGRLLAGTPAGRIATTIGVLESLREILTQADEAAEPRVGAPARKGRSAR